jgi:hypothetical protein
MVLVTTHWEEPKDTLAYEKQERHRRQLANDKWKVWIAKGRPLHRMKGETPAAAKEIVSALFKNEIRLRCIQEKLAEQMQDEIDQQQAVRNLRKELRRQLASSEGGRRLEIEAELKLLNCYGTPSKFSAFWSSLFG